MECEYDPDPDKKSRQNIFMEVEPAEQSQTSFTDLNDDCLFKVFGYLDFFDMLNISRTCKRLNDASSMVAKRFKIFCMKTYSEELILRENQQPTALLVDRVMQYIAPIVESIRSTFHKYSYEEVDPLQSLEKYDLPKLKSLSLHKSEQLAWIRNKNVEQLTINHVERGDLNNYASRMTRVKQLSLTNIHSCVPTSELLHFFDNNPNIERLMFVQDIERKLPEKFFTKFKNLKMLEFTMGQHPEDLLLALQIDNLTEVILKYKPNCGRNNDNSILANNTAERFLTSMAQKQTLQSLDLRDLYFNELVDSLAALNLVSLRYISKCNFGPFYSKLATTPFPTLKRINILAPVDIGTLIALIQNLTAVEDMQFPMISWSLHRKQEFSEHLTRFLSGSKQPNRPELKISFLIDSLTIKVSEFEANIFK